MRTPLAPDAKDLRLLCEQSIAAVLTHLLPGGHRQGKEWCVGSTSGEQGNSLKVCMKGSKVGLWADFAGASSGDILDLWQAVRGLTFVETLKDVAQFFGVQAMPKFHGHDDAVVKRKSYRKPSAPKGSAKPDEGSDVWTYLTMQRGLSEATVKLFRIGERKCGLSVVRDDKSSPVHGPEVIFGFFNPEQELVGLKYLAVNRPEINGKVQRIIHAEAECQPILFGWQAMSPNARFVVITEGEINAMSLHELGVPSLATPFGAGHGAKHAWIEHEYDRLQRFERIYLLFDEDSAGSSAIADLVERLGRHRCLVMPHLGREIWGKDPNDWLINGADADLIAGYLAEAKSVDPEELRNASEFRDAIIEEFYPTDGAVPGFAFPMGRIAEKLFMRWAEVSIVTGHPGHGKTRWLSHIAASAGGQGARVCVASLEDRPQKYLRKLTQQVLARELPTIPQIDEAVEWYKNRFWIFALTGVARRERMLEVFAYARRRYNVRLFIIDSLMKCGLAETDYDGQKLFIEDLTNFANLHDVAIMIVAHPKKEHSEEEVPGMYGVRGGAAIAGLAMNGFTIHRNKTKERKIRELSVAGIETLEDEQKLEALQAEYDALFYCWKDRENGEDFAVKLWFDRPTGLFHDSPISMSSHPIAPIDYEPPA